MRSTPLRRRLTYGVLTGGLVAGVLVPLSASAAPCFTYVDAAGDAAILDPATAPVTGDPALDILGITHSSAGGVLSSTVQLAALHDYGSEYSIGDAFELNFTVAEKRVSLYVQRDANIEGTTTVETTVDGDVVELPAEAVYDFEAATVVVSLKLADLDKAVGAALKGKAFTEMDARAFGNYSAFALTWDLAAAEEGATYVVGAACKGGAAAAKPAATPAASASAQPSASASPEPSGSASPEPSGSASPEPSASGSASPEPSASASPEAPPPPPEPTVPVPAEGCVGFADEAGDSNASIGPIPFGDDPDLDIVSVTGRTTEDTISGHLGITELSSPSFPITGHRFEYEFAAGGKTITLRASGPGVGTGLVDGSATADLSVSAVFDEVSSQVVLTVDRASLVKVLEAPLPDGAVLTDTAARSYAQTPASSSVADTASPEQSVQAAYVIGDNECFRPKMSVTAPARVQTSDVALVSVALVTSDGRVAKEQTVLGRIGSGRAVSAVTDAQGTATMAVPVTVAAGVQDLVVRSSGEAGEGELRTTVRVLVERTVLSVSRTGSGSTRTVTATLSDDDAPGRRLAGQRLTFTFGGRNVVATTDRTGRAVASVPAGSVVDVSFAGRPGFLSAAKARTTA